ncbi:hypothetical protein CI109_104125 [Kwoniella shandongensis]|uniref:Uncharacterized protein n=1 Tax=Kwoniella shandongensis TaxID=1734106 RepID=A0A5M6C4U0_9TREE|nr:uncharacterized protein CI109_002962 [Kwoniella shandongensis]KAA5528802.1 hypothetical protein CI109_002962 [Kwoniella shandongensis]
MVGSSDMSKNETIRPASPSSSSTRTPTPLSTTSTTPAINVPTSSRIRNPPPPSPLSKVQSVSPDNRQTSISFTNPLVSTPPPPSAAIPPPGQSRGAGAAMTSAPTTAMNPAQSSPCFIHSHLDRHGSLQDWLNKKASTSGPSSVSAGSTTSTATHRPQISTHHSGNATKPVRPPTYHKPSNHVHNHHATIQTPSVTPSPSGSHPGSPTGTGSKFTSPILKDSSFSGYDSDQSSLNGHTRQRSTGSAILDADLVDEEEEGGSLTRQLAETAQGVREMSKELGRTRVRSKIQHVLIVTKARDNRLIKLTRELALYLMQKRPAATPDGNHRSHQESRDRGMVVYVDAQLRTSKRFDAAGMQRDYPNLFQPITRRRSSSSASVSTLATLSAYPSTASMGEFARRNKDEGQLRYWTSEMCSNSPHLFDFVVTLGGDGTVLFTSWLFQRIVPPVLPFALGSLGFLTNFDFAQYKQTMDKVVDDGIRVNLRMRFTCTVYRAIAPEEAEMTMNGKGGKKRKAIKKPGGEILMSHVDKGGWESLEGPPPTSGASESEGKDKEIMCFSTRAVEQFEVLNDLVVDRGPSPYVSLLELFGDEHHLTTVQADGLTVSTPTGSTAYSLSAGGSLVHPQIPALLITPICPHTLSFRPMLLPDSMELRICVPYNSRSTAWASFDGRGRVELKQGDHIKVTASKYPFPTVCADKASTDWFASISRTLRWNEREKQKSFVVVEEESEPPNKSTGKKTLTKKSSGGDAKIAKGVKEEDETEEDDEEDEDEEDEQFDIDDKSGGESEPASPPIEPAAPPKPPPLQKRHSLIPTHKSGLETPNRFATPYQGPPPLSQRHLVEALAAAEIREKENENGQRDNIRGDGSESRVNGHHHLIPPGRSNIPSPAVREGEESEAERSTSDSNSMANSMIDQQTPREGRSATQGHVHHHHHHHHHHAAEGETNHQGRGRSPSAHKAGEGKAKAFAFFGQDDSASDCSDDHSD